MTRLEKVYTELTSGYSGGEVKGGGIISDWTPNNLRAIFVSADYVVLVHYVATAKQPLIKVISLSAELLEDLTTFVEGKKKVKGVLGAVAKGKICSNLEDIVFVSHCEAVEQGSVRKDLVDALMVREREVFELTKKGWSGDTVGLKDRFPRLHIWETTVPIKKIVKYCTTNGGNEATKHTTYTDLLNEPELQNNTRVLYSTDNYTQNIRLRPSFYALDEQDKPLSVYLRTLKDKDAYKEKIQALKNSYETVLNSFVSRGFNLTLKVFNDSIGWALKKKTETFNAWERYNFGNALTYSSFKATIYTSLVRYLETQYKGYYIEPRVMLMLQEKVPILYKMLDKVYTQGKYTKEQVMSAEDLNRVLNFIVGTMLNCLVSLAFVRMSTLEHMGEAEYYIRLVQKEKGVGRLSSYRVVEALSLYNYCTDDSKDLNTLIKGKLTLITATDVIFKDLTSTVKLIGEVV